MPCSAPQLYQVGNVGRELVDLSVVEPLDVLKQATVFCRDEVNCHTLSTETAGINDTAQIVLWLCREIEVDNQRHLQGHTQP
jgi:hypothetical protein